MLLQIIEGIYHCLHYHLDFRFNFITENAFEHVDCEMSTIFPGFNVLGNSL